MIDWDQVLELRDEVGAEDFGEVVDVFLEEVEQGLVDLQSAGSPAELESLLHLLKGCAWNLGFRAVGSLCAAGEGRAAAGDADPVDKIELASVYAESKAVFLAGLPARDIVLDAA
jgi:HPt (histidine-containing phosphotransfer) domain-containing protein